MKKPAAGPTKPGQGRGVIQMLAKAATATALPDSAAMDCLATEATVCSVTVVMVETDTLLGCSADSQGREEDVRAPTEDTQAAVTEAREPIMVASVMPPAVGMPGTAS